MTRRRAFGAGFLAGLTASLLMTATMLFLAWLFGVATPPVIFGDRISVFIPADDFLALMGRLGGYNNMKQLGVASVMTGQIAVGTLAGIIYGFVMRRRPRNRLSVTGLIFILLPLLAVTAFLWPVLGTHYHGLPINRATVLTVVGLFVAFVVFERALVLAFHALTQLRTRINDQDFSPPIGRRALLVSGVALFAAGGGAGLLRRLYELATFSYDGTQYKGRVVRPITPNDQFYCVTKNVVDPKVNPNLWRLEVTGLVQTKQTYRFDRLKSLPAVEQETTLMCISNGLDAGLMSNAKWKGVPMKVLLSAASPLAGVTKVRLHGVDNYTDTIPFAKTMDPTTLVAYEMNGEKLPDRHGFPARVIVPGYFGEKHVKWITRIEVADETAVGFYEKQGWGPDFIIPTRSRFDEPDHDSTIPGAIAANGVAVRGVAFGGSRGVSRVEVSLDDGKTWGDARLDYPGTKLTWAIWSFDWRPAEARDYILVVRATDGEGIVQTWDEQRPFKSGVTGFHKIRVHVV
ncbi:MAG TPA: molybdopterin-dependent oxidoreductase [Chthoniobacterales bacterium]|nr:molybdopterin-dependent oxidoreductase [Chthoniobacterales bacterium]